MIVPITAKVLCVLFAQRCVDLKSGWVYSLSFEPVLAISLKLSIPFILFRRQKSTKWKMFIKVNGKSTNPHPYLSVSHVKMFLWLLQFDIHNQSINLLLDGHGRARREAARRRKYEWKVNLDIRNSSRGSASKRLQNCIIELRGVWTYVSLQ